MQLWLSLKAKQKPSFTNDKIIWNCFELLYQQAERPQGRLFVFIKNF
ncbi:MAG: hypothetical protein ACOYJ1_07525 [Peptococcales bacterium]